MKAILRKLCSPVLGMFESGEVGYEYKKSHRTILIVLGFLCIFLSSISLSVTLYTGEFVGVIPILMFFLTGLVCEIVGFLGSDQAVARIWKRK